MSGLSERTDPVLGSAPQDSRAPLLLSYAVDTLVVAVWFAVAGVIGAVAWWKITPLAAYTRTKQDAVMPATEFGKQVATDGWYVVIAVGLGLASGIVLTLWRRRDPLVLVVLMALGGTLAAFVMLRLGLHLGPADPRDVIKDLPVGAKAPLQLRPQAKGVWAVWPIAALVGTIVILLGTSLRQVEGPNSG